MGISKDQMIARDKGGKEVPCAAAQEIMGPDMCGSDEDDERFLCLYFAAFVCAILRTNRSENTLYTLDFFQRRS